MPLTRRGPLQLLQREIHELQRRVDRLMKDVQGQVESSDDALRRCQDLQVSANKTLKALQKLTKADEPAPVRNYDRWKQKEEKRLQNTLEYLNALFIKLSPPGPSTDIGYTCQDGVDEDDEGDSSSDDDDDDDEDVDEDDDEYEERRAVKPPSQSNPRIYTVLSDFKGEQEGDLSVQRGELLRIIRKTADGWWMAQDMKGNRGVVPKTFLNVGHGVEDDDDDDDDDGDNDDDDDGDDDENEELDENEDGKELTDDQKKRSSASTWSTVRKALTKIDTTDVLSAMGAIPPGFRPSTLSKLLDEDATYRGSYYIQPELSQSQLSFKDLFLDPDTGRVRARQVGTCVCFTLWSCRHIPIPGVGIQVLSRHIRLCAFDGTQVLSNIHTVRADYNPKTPKTWNFSPKVTGMLPTLLDGSCFLRCNSSSPNLGILFELGVTFIRNSTGERGDLSCGWAFLKLTDNLGNPLSNRMYELPVKGGTPYETDVMLEASLARKTAGGVLQQMLQARRQPKLIVKLKSANTKTRTQLSLLPDTFLFCLSCIHLLVLHQQLLADKLLMDRPTMQNSDLICNPILSTFPALLEQTDLLDALRSVWLEGETNMSRTQKRDLSYLKEEFVKVYMSSVYFLLHSPLLPPQRWADPSSEEQRAKVIYYTLDALKDYQQATGQRAGPDIFFDSKHAHLAFDVTELSFDLLGAAR